MMMLSPMRSATNRRCQFLPSIQNHLTGALDVRRRSILSFDRTAVQLYGSSCKKWKTATPASKACSSSWTHIVRVEEQVRQHRRAQIRSRSTTWQAFLFCHVVQATAEGPPRLPRATVTSAPAPDPSEGSRTRPDRGFADPGGGWPVGLGPAPH
jgi:hypothetical protein